ncbi:MAG: RdgB/HAM1 family non-canonical purine NTP pyrophosphatase [Bacilli bacterium]|nr:RdgB/HAM1 family non-canonical purine NTP pyrophosphatase [Bacilli bacterium]
MILATNNKGKLEEIRKILTDYEIYSLKDKNINVDVEEDRDSFLGNAMKKAKEIYEVSHEEIIADDSGLCINSLNGFPGVMTHRFLGDDATDRMRNEYLINEVNKHEDRSAQVICCLVYYDGEQEVVGQGILNGFISKECRGSNGFGFDEIFELPSGLTLAELSSDEKNNISARSLAINDLKKKLKSR